MSNLPRHLWESTEELEEAILNQIRKHHVGRANAIRIPDLAKIVFASDRKVRAAIQSLRSPHPGRSWGWPICTSIGDPPGAFWPETDTEFWRFIQRAFRPRWMTMKKTEEAMIEGLAILKHGQLEEKELQPELISS